MTTLLTVAQVIASLRKMPQDAHVFAAQYNSERSYRVGAPFITVGGDVVLAVGAIFIEDEEDEEATDEATDEAEYTGHDDGFATAFNRDLEEQMLGRPLSPNEY